MPGGLYAAQIHDASNEVILAGAGEVESLLLLSAADAASATASPWQRVVLKAQAAVKNVHARMIRGVTIEVRRGELLLVGCVSLAACEALQLGLPSATGDELHGQSAGRACGRLRSHFTNDRHGTITADRSLIVLRRR
jgi:hypothetical protein